MATWMDMWRTQWIGSASSILTSIRTIGIDTIVAVAPSMSPEQFFLLHEVFTCLLYTSPSPRDTERS
eukprot:5729720-Karenia_brevis.AAC.1